MQSTRVLFDFSAVCGLCGKLLSLLILHCKLADSANLFEDLHGVGCSMFSDFALPFLHLVHALDDEVRCCGSQRDWYDDRIEQLRTQVVESVHD